jgi:anti-sigma-K factor RskA
MSPDFDSSTPTPPDDLRGEIAAYSIGALEAHEAAAVKRMLDADPALKREAVEYAAAASMLSLTVPRKEPPAALKGKILAAARESRPPMLTVMPKTAPARPERRLRDVLAFVASAAAVLLFAFSMYLMNQTNVLREREAQIAAENVRMATAVAQLSAQPTPTARSGPPSNPGMETAVKLLTAPDTHRVELMGDDGSMKAMVMFAPSHSEALVVTSNLPSLDEEHTYQLWQIGHDGQPISAGMFETNSNGIMAMIFEPVIAWDAVSAVGISVEPIGGSEAPTTTPLAMATME